MNKAKQRSLQLKDLSWLEIVHVLANLMGTTVNVDYHGGFDWCTVEFYWIDDIHNNQCISGFGRAANSTEASSMLLVKNVMKYGAIGPYKKYLNFPCISFDSKEEFQLKLEIAGCDLQQEVAGCNIYRDIYHRTQHLSRHLSFDHSQEGLNEF